ncbi:cell wall / vacuolar inhibitor of fructosidase 1-like [Rhodamnia argentea]|uniref:Cell wall / vacuolar inhibitor of fructosidase 1-like n=1 Tax=Rhodamnia argentea TaxID=178133 RepID=A0A8B8PYI4_9MYRT|nr:cell wall / vacuolar inhibitor of fructosidase 1-like [Rhodamnia argentea]
MKTRMLLTHLSFTQLLLITFLPFASADLVNDTCKNTPDPDFCFTALSPDPRSSAADAKTLGIIMVEKVDQIAKATLAGIGSLLGQSPDPRTKQALTSCEKSHEIITTSVAPTKESSTEGGYKFAEVSMSGAATSVSRCEADFGGSKLPISGLNDFEHKAAMVASAIAGSLR